MHKENEDLRIEGVRLLATYIGTLKLIDESHVPKKYSDKKEVMELKQINIELAELQKRYLEISKNYLNLEDLRKFRTILRDLRAFLDQMELTVSSASNPDSSKDMPILKL